MLLHTFIGTKPGPAGQEFHGSQVDALYEAITAYLNSKGNQDVHRLLASLPRNSSKVTFTLAREAQTADTYRCFMLSSSASPNTSQWAPLLHGGPVRCLFCGSTSGCEPVHYRQPAACKVTSDTAVGHSAVTPHLGCAQWGAVLVDPPHRYQVGHCDRHAAGADRGRAQLPAQGAALLHSCAELSKTEHRGQAHTAVDSVFVLSSAAIPICPGCSNRY